MNDLDTLLAGYRAFREGRYAEQVALYRELAHRGQKPRTLIIGCSDSRVDPMTIFNARPGELFIVRNVAALVPPYQPDGHFHGTSAALEFAVTGLGVSTIMVLGHASCGGIHASLTDMYDTSGEEKFIQQWMSIIEPARQKVLRQSRHPSLESAQPALEREAIRLSLHNLMSFPFVRERVDKNELSLVGAHFGIESGELELIDGDPDDNAT